MSPACRTRFKQDAEAAELLPVIIDAGEEDHHLPGPLHQAFCGAGGRHRVVAVFGYPIVIGMGVDMDVRLST